MAKTSWKEQVYQSLANSHVQQALEQQRQQQAAQLQADFIAWQQKQAEALQADYQNWLNSQQQQAQTVQPSVTPTQVKTNSAPKQKEQEKIPSIEDYFRPKTASGRDLHKEAAKKQQREDYQKQQQLEQMQAEKHYTGKGSDEWKQSVNDTLNTLNSKETKVLNKAIQAQKKREEVVEEAKNVGSGIKQMDNISDIAKMLDEKSGEDTTEAKKNFEDYTKALQWSSPDYKMSKEEQKEARRIASEGMQEIASRYPVEDKADFGKLYDRLSPEDQEKYRTYEDLDYKSTFMPALATGAADKAVSMIGGLLDTAAFFHPEAKAAARDYKKIQEKWDEKSEDTVNLAKSVTPFVKDVPYIGDITPYGTGEMATQIGAYALTNEAYDALGAALGGGSKITGFVGNQIGQNAQDISLDTIPLLRDLAKDGELSDEDWKALGTNVKNNALGNLVMGGIGTLPALKKSVKDYFGAKNAADAAFRANVLEGADNLAKAADSVRAAEKVNQLNLEDMLKQSEVDSVVKNATEQTENAVQNIQDIAKQMPEIPDEDIKLSDNEINKLVRGMEPAENAAETVENATKTQRPVYSEEVEAKITSDFDEMRYSLDNMQKAAEESGSEKALEKFKKLRDSVFDYENKIWNTTDAEEISKAKKSADAARQSFIREMKKVDPNYKGDLTGTKLGNAEYRVPKTGTEEDINAMVQEWTDYETNNPNRFVRDAEPENQKVFRGVDNVPGAEPLQTFAEGPTKGDWKTSKAYKTFERMGYGDALKEEDFAYRVFHADEQRALAAERYKDSENLAKDLLNRDYAEFDEADIKAIYPEMEALHNNGDRNSLRTLDRLAKKSAAVERESGRILQAKQEFSNTIGAALQDAHKAQDDFVLDPWRSKNKKAREGNSRIAKALADMGHNEKKSLKPELTHDQIKKGVIAELEREVGSVEKYFNDNDIEFLTQLAEDKSIPVWQITSEIEHKLDTGNWYTLDESIELPKPTNAKLQAALNSLVEETVRAEKEAPLLNQIVDEVRNTLGKESSNFDGLFTEDDINYLANLIHEGASKEEIAQALDLKMATGSWGISDATLQEVNNIFKEISNYDPNSKQFVEGQAKAYALLADEILPNATMKEKFEAWRYIAMLGNPKTMLRNLVGNATFNVVTGISNNVAAVAEAGIDKAIKAFDGEGIQRTKAVLNPKADGGLIKAAWEDADASRYRQIIGSKYEKISKDTLKKSKSVFNSKLAQLYEKATDAGISDYTAVKAKYSTSLAGYMKANGMDTSIFKAEDELRRLKELSNQRLLSGAEKSQMDNLTKQVADLNKARDYALKQAEYATFHEDNAIANVLSKWSRTSKEEGKGIGHVLIEGVVPFKKTPANVLKSGYEYSPLGAISSIKNTGKLIYENTGKRAGNLADTYLNKQGKEVARTLASDVIDSWSKTLTGTGLTALGYYLYNKGILHSSNPDTKYQDQLEGHQNYSIEINGKSYTIDWAAPTIMPLMIGAEIAKLWDSTGKGDENFYDNIDGYLNAANRLADPLIETSMLSGVKDTLETAASAAQYNENLNVPTLLAYNTLTGYATQGIPTLGGQIARTIDPTRRSTYTDKEGVAGILDKQGKKLMNKIPGLSMLNEPYVDTYGREQQNSPFSNPALNLGYQMLSPGYLSNINETDADKMSREAYAVGHTESTLPKWQSKFKDAEGNRVSPEDYTKASKAYGEANYEIRDALANDKWFNGLSDTQQEEIVKGINTIAEHTGNAAIDPEYDKNSKPYIAYRDGGIKGLINYYKEQDAKNTAKDLLGDSGVTTNSKAGKAIVEAVQNGNMKQAEKLAEEAKAEKAEKVKTEETKDTLSSYGLTNIGPAKTYEKAQSVIPGLTTEKFAATYKKMDNDGNQSIKQDEIINYLNSNNISESEGKKIWEAYGNKSWKKIPTLENGKWKKK